MFDKKSRYTDCEDKSITSPDGRIINYKGRRFLPLKMAILQNVTVTAGDRLDLIANRVMGDSEQYWRICDANDALNPTDLVEPGKILKVPQVWR